MGNWPDGSPEGAETASYPHHGFGQGLVGVGNWPGGAPTGRRRPVIHTHSEAPTPAHAREWEAGRHGGGWGQAGRSPNGAETAWPQPPPRRFIGVWVTGRAEARRGGDGQLSTPRGEKVRDF